MAGRWSCGPKSVDHLDNPATGAHRGNHRCLRPDHLRRPLAIPLVVGTWLALFNQGDRLAASALGAALAGTVLLNSLTPLVVSNWGLVAGRTGERDG